MSIIFYIVRQKKNKGLFYRRRVGKDAGGWVEGIKNASVWGQRQGPNQVLKVVGKENGEIVPVTGLVQEGKYDYIFAARNIHTGQFITNKKQRSRGVFYSKRWDDAGTWTRPQHVKTLIRTWVKYCKHESMMKYNLTIKAEEIEIIKMPIFIPPRNIT